MAPQPTRNDCCRSCLRGSLRGLNYLLAIVGVLMTAYALFMWVQWEEATNPDAPTPPPALLDELNHLPHRAFGMKNPAASIVTDPLDGVVLGERLIEPEPTTPTFTDEAQHQQMGKGDDPDPKPGKTYAPCLTSHALRYCYLRCTVPMAMRFRKSNVAFVHRLTTSSHQAGDAAV